MSVTATSVLPITTPLKSVRARLRLLACLHGLFRTLWITLAAVLVAGLADYLLSLPGLLRMTLVLCFTGYFLYSLLRYALRPLLAPLPLDVIAAEVERLNPQLQDRLRSTLVFAGKPVPGAAALQEAVLQETLAAMNSLNVGGIVNARPMRNAALIFLPVVAAFAGLWLWQPLLLGIGLNRFMLPMSPITWPRMVQIELLQRLPKQIPVGQRLSFAVRLTQGDRPDRKVVANWQIAGQTMQQQLMQRQADGSYTSGIDVRANDQASAPGATMPGMKLWIESGDDSYGPIPIELIPRLQVTKVQLAATTPAYCRLEPLSFDLRTQPATVPLGSKLSLAIAFNRNARNIRLEAVGGAGASDIPAIQWTNPSANSTLGIWQAKTSLRFRIRAEDAGGYANPATEEYELTVRPDQMPVIQLESPRRSEDRTPEATLPLEASVEDDFGIDDVVLEARLFASDTSTSSPTSTTAPASTPPVALPLVAEQKAVISQAAFTPAQGDGQRKRFHLAFAWKLASFPSSLLKPGDVIEFQLAARDNFDLDNARHPFVKTPPLRITIISQEQLQQRTYDDLRQVASQLGEIKTRQDRLRNDTTGLKEDTATKKVFEPADDTIADRVADQQVRTSSQTKDISSRLTAIGKRLQENASPNADLQQAVQSTSRTLNKAADDAMKPAAAQVKQSTDRTNPPDARNTKLDDAAKLQQQASQQVSQAIDQLGDLCGLQRAVDMIHDLLTQQRKLSQETAQTTRDLAGKRPEDLKPEDKRKLDDLAKRQNDLAKQSEKAIDQLSAMAKRQASSDPSAAEAMKQAAQTGKTQSVSQHQQNAGKSVSQNQSSQASSSQQSAEAGLQEMLASLREAQQRKLEELLKKLAGLEQQIQILVHRQAGHNLDNVLLQNPKAADGQASELFKTLFTKSQRKESGPLANLTGLTASQQQTHRNASDLSVDLDKVKGADQAALHLNKAAGRMERSIVLLKASNLKEALLPPQMDALAELELTLQQVAELKRKAQDQAKQKKQDELRQAYELVKAQEVQMRDVTKLLDTALSAGQRKRSDTVRLAQLAADQLKLQEKVRSLGEELAKLGSTVFNRANDSVARDMGSVSDQLSKDKTGKGTQLQQGMIISKIDAIIRGLKPETPDPSKYANRSGSGSGQGGKKQRKLPPAAELQLLKDFQQLVNSGTQNTATTENDLLAELSRQQAGIRTTLDELIKNATQGEVTMPDEKQSREPVAEESNDPGKTEADDFDRQLLGDGTPDPAKPDAAKSDQLNDVKLTGRRMTRSQVRLGEDQDPGKVTQVVQQKIVDALDRFIDEAKKSQQQQQASSQSESEQEGKPDPNSKPKPGDPSPGKPGGQTAAAKSQISPGGNPPSPTGDIRETAKDWGGISQRDRQAIIESAGENIIEKYRTLTEEYYRALSVKATENR